MGSVELLLDGNIYSDVQKRLEKLNGNIKCRLDNIHPWVLQNMAKATNFPLEKIFKEALRDRVIVFLRIFIIL